MGKEKQFLVEILFITTLSELILRFEKGIRQSSMASYRNLTFGDSVKHDQRKFKHLAPKTAGNYNGNNSNHHEYDKIGQKISGLERRKKENRKKRRSKKRIFNLTPAIPNMASI